MKDPVRWLDGGTTSPLVCELLRAAPPMPPLDPNTNAQLALCAKQLTAGGLAVAGGLTSGAGHWLIACKLVATVGLGASLGALASHVYEDAHARRNSDHMGQSRSSQENERPGLVQKESSFSGSADGGAKNHRAKTDAVRSFPPTLRVPQATSKQLETRSPTNNAGSVSSGNQSPDSLQAEAALLEQARRALTSDPNRSLQVVKEHEVRFAQGLLVTERELIAVEALLRLGNLQAAELRAAPYFLNQSIYASRLKNLFRQYGLPARKQP